MGVGLGRGHYIAVSSGDLRWQRRDSQRSGSATAKVVREGTDLGQTDEGSLHFRQRSRGLVRPNDQIAASTEQRQAKLVFEIANEATDCWLGETWIISAPVVIAPVNMTARKASIWRLWIMAEHNTAAYLPAKSEFDSRAADTPRI
jgi:hypothetical protein